MGRQQILKLRSALVLDEREQELVDLTIQCVRDQLRYFLGDADRVFGICCQTVRDLLEVILLDDLVVLSQGL